MWARKKCVQSRPIFIFAILLNFFSLSLLLICSKHCEKTGTNFVFDNKINKKNQIQNGEPLSTIVCDTRNKLCLKIYKKIDRLVNRYRVLKNAKEKKSSF